MSSSANSDVEFKIAPQESLSIIGSNSIDTAGDLYVIDVNSVNKSSNKRKKRIIDISFSLISIPLFPLLILIVKSPVNFLLNIVKVLFGINTWVGYERTPDFSEKRKGIIFPSDVVNEKNITPEISERLNKIYAKDYSAMNDVKIILKGINKLGK